MPPHMDSGKGGYSLAMRFHLPILLLPLAVPILFSAHLSAQAQLPRSYAAPFLTSAPAIDGLVDEAAWGESKWSEPFVDIEGEPKPRPNWETRVRMAWDSSYFYIAAVMEEPNLWATLTERDAVIYHDNDFEWFIDPDGDSNRYFELEVNALGTIWDLFLDKPYRNGGKADNGWDIDGLISAIRLDGSLNDPSDVDLGWAVEMAIPWQAFSDNGRTSIPPEVGEKWRINFSRVQWDLKVIEGVYQKRTGEDGKALPEHNWVWSPQGEINMHIPEMWGVVSFVLK